MSHSYEELQALYEGLRLERDELLEALEKIAVCMSAGPTATDIALAALAKARDES